MTGLDYRALLIRALAGESCEADDAHSVVLFGLAQLQSEARALFAVEQAQPGQAAPDVFTAIHGLQGRISALRELFDAEIAAEWTTTPETAEETQ